MKGNTIELKCTEKNRTEQQKNNRQNKFFVYEFFGDKYRIALIVLFSLTLRKYVVALPLLWIHH